MSLPITLTARIAPKLSRDWLYRWAFIAAYGALAWIGLSTMTISAQFVDITGFLLKMAALLGALGATFFALRSSRLAIQAAGAFFSNASQFVAFSLASLSMTYVAASLRMPLCDDALVRADALLGFDWHAAAAWVGAHSAVQSVFVFAYGTLIAQLFVLLFVQSANKKTEFLWLFMICDALTTAACALLPAVGEVGLIGQQHINDFLAAREGNVAALNGIVTFPSAHAALAVLLAYSSRGSKLFYVALPLNVLMLLSTPVVGGHYLIDVIAGAGMAVAAIAIYKKVAF